MNTKRITGFLAILSGLGITYFVFSTFRDFGSIDSLTADTRILLTTLAVTIVPLVLAWSGVWWISQAQSMHGHILKLLGSSALAWALLFFGSIYLALLRFQ